MIPQYDALITLVKADEWFDTVAAGGALDVPKSEQEIGASDNCRTNCPGPAAPGGRLLHAQHLLASSNSLY